MYKDILWIDDIDNNEGTSAELEDELDMEIVSYDDNIMSDEEKEALIEKDDNLKRYAQRIKLCRKMLSGCKEIDENYRHYNLVIFDMNMINGWLNRADDIQKLSEILTANKMNGYEDDGDEDEIAGIYLYLLLLIKKGYFEYEDVYNFNQNNSPKIDADLFGKIKNKLMSESSLPLVLNRKTWKESIPYSELVWLWGEDKNNRAHIHYILFPLIMKDYSMQFQTILNNVKLNALNGENNLFKGDIISPQEDDGFIKLAFNEAYRICCEDENKNNT